MSSANITALTNYGGAQSPNDLMYIGRSPFSTTDDRKTTLNDLFAEYSKNTTDGSFRMAGVIAPALSAAGKGSIYFSSASNIFLASENGGAYRALIASPGGSNKQVQFNNSAAFGGAAGFEYQSGASPNVLIVAQANGHTPLWIKQASTSQTANLFEITDPTGTAVVFAIDADGTPSTPQLDSGPLTGARFGVGCSTSSTGATFGDNSGATAAQSCAFGDQAEAIHNSSIAIGYQSNSAGANTFVAGSRNAPVNTVLFGYGGDDVIGSPAALTFRGNNSNLNNTAGGNLIVQAGPTRGTGATNGANNNSSVVLSTYPSADSGATLSTPSERYIVRGHRYNLTDSTDNSLFEIALPTLKGAGGRIGVTLFATNGTDVQTVHYQLTFAVVNKSGAYTSDIDQIQVSSALSAGTLSATFNFLTGANKVTFRVNPASSLTTTIYYALLTLENNSEQAITLL